MATRTRHSRPTRTPDPVAPPPAESYAEAFPRSTKVFVEGPRGAAGLLKMHPNTLRSRIEKLGIRRSDHETS
jgi:hypothetical protein